jgi:hypothetical protein
MLPQASPRSPRPLVPAVPAPWPRGPWHISEILPAVMAELLSRLVPTPADAARTR